MDIRLPYLVQDLDRHGNVRLYLRKTGLRKIRIREPINSPRFLAVYQEALRKIDTPSLQGKEKDPNTGTLGWLFNEFEHSFAFKKVGPRQQRVRHLIHESILNESPSAGSSLKFRGCPIGSFKQDNVRDLRDRKSATPGAANTRLSCLRVIFSWALEERSNWVNDNPTRLVRDFKYKSEGFHTWTPQEVEQYEKRHPVGSKARLALAIMIFTGMRRSDAVLLGNQHLKAESDGTWITFTPQKTSTTSGKVLTIPLLEQLREVLDASSLGVKTFLETGQRKPFTANGFGNWFRDRCNEAGLDHCTSHGLRKVGAVIASENGATIPQMMAIFGWETTQLAAHYSKKADQKKLAGDAMHLLIAQKRVSHSGSNPKSGTTDSE